MTKTNGVPRHRLLNRVEAFCADLTVTKAAALHGNDRNSANRDHRPFCDNQPSLLAQFTGTGEVDESWCGPTPLAGPTWAEDARARH